MFDIFSYWIGVSVVCLVLMYGVIMYSLWLVDKWIKRVTNGECNNVIKSLVPWWLYPKVKGGWQEVTSGIGILSLVIMVMFFAVTNTQDFAFLPTTEVIHRLATTFSPVCGWVFIVVIIAKVLDIVTKKGYKIGKMLYTFSKTTDTSTDK